MYNFFRMLSIISGLIFLGLCTLVYFKRRKDKHSITTRLRFLVLLSFISTLTLNSLSNQLNSDYMNDILLNHYENNLEYEDFNVKDSNRALTLINTFKDLKEEDKKKYINAYKYFFKQYLENQNKTEKEINFNIENYITDHI